MSSRFAAVLLLANIGLLVLNGWSFTRTDGAIQIMVGAAVFVNIIVIVAAGFRIWYNEIFAPVQEKEINGG